MWRCRPRRRPLTGRSARTSTTPHPISRAPISTPHAPHPQETFGELKGQLDGPSFNILMTLVKEKVEALGPYARDEFEQLCALFGLDDKFREVEAAAASEGSSESKGGAAAAVEGSKKKGAGKAPPQPSETAARTSELLSNMAPEDLARHRRMLIKRKELAELQGMQDREAELFQEAEANLKSTKDKLRAVYNDMGSLAPEAQKLLQRCAEN